MKRKFTTAILAAIVVLFAAISMNAQTMTVRYYFNGTMGDSSSNTYNAVPNGVTYTNDIAGITGNAVHFDGATAYVGVPNYWVTGQTSVAMSIWFKTENHTKPGGLLYAGLEGVGNTPTNFSPLMWMDSAGHLCGYFWDGFASNVSSSTDTVNDDKWHHAVFILFAPTTAMNQEIWLDGKSLGLKSGNIMTGNSFNNIIIGACNPRNFLNMPDHWDYFKGTIDEFAVLTSCNELTRYQLFHNFDLLITEHPADVNAGIGTNPTMHISHTYFNPDSTYTYQWVKNGMAVLVGQTDSILHITNMDWTDTGYYKCYVKNQNNYEIASYEGHLTAVPAGVNNTPVETTIKMYPNPANNIVFLDLEGTLEAEVSIVSLTGQTLISRKGVSRNARLDVGGLTPGVYSICIRDEKGTRYKKFVKSSN